MIAGCILSAILFIPLFKGLSYSVNPALQSAQERAPVVVFADPARCSFQFNLLNTSGRNVQSCDIAKAFLSQSGVAYSNDIAPAGMVAQIQVGREVVEAYEGGQLDARQHSVLFKRNVTAALERAGYPLKADVASVNQPMVVFLLWVLLVLAAMVYGPMVALLVDIFPTRIRYTSMSLPYHIGNGWFGGILPTLAFAMVAATGDVYFGLWYPIGVAFFAAVVALWVHLPKSEAGKEF